MTDQAVDHISNRCILVVLVYQLSLLADLVNQERQYRNSPTSFLRVMGRMSDSSSTVNWYGDSSYLCRSPETYGEGNIRKCLSQNALCFLTSSDNSFSTDGALPSPLSPPDMLPYYTANDNQGKCARVKLCCLLAMDSVEKRHRLSDATLES